MHVNYTDEMHVGAVERVLDLRFSISNKSSTSISSASTFSVGIEVDDYTGCVSNK